MNRPKFVGVVEQATRVKQWSSILNDFVVSFHFDGTPANESSCSCNYLVIYLASSRHQLTLDHYTSQPLPATSGAIKTFVNDIALLELLSQRFMYGLCWSMSNMVARPDEFITRSAKSPVSLLVDSVSLLLSHYYPLKSNRLFQTNCNP